MVATRKYINLDDIPEIAATARETERSGEPIDLRMDGKTVAVLEPRSTWKPDDPRRFSPEQKEQSITGGGGWAGLIDPEQFLRDNEASRRISNRHSPAEREDFKNFAGSWTDLDTNAMVENIYELRDSSSRRTFEE